MIKLIGKLSETTERSPPLFLTTLFLVWLITKSNCYEKQGE